jgi:CRISPR system Cascade subunit CasE
MIQMKLDGLKLARMSRAARLPPHATDHGYLIHMTLKELFGDIAPQPFAVRDNSGRTLDILGYSPAPADVLKARADTYAAPNRHTICDWGGLASKPMPTEWPKGADLHFELTTCPVQRMASSGPKHRKGAEVDVFLAECWRAEDPTIPVDRYAVYREWLAERLRGQGGCTLEAVEIVSFRKARLVRRTHGDKRKAKTLDKPEVVFRGRLKVTEGNEFNQLLAGGFGRHKAFGYGMLLLRRA